VPCVWCGFTGILEETTNKGNTELEKAIFSHADAVTNKFFGQSVYYRGIVEFSNVCANDCGYCGIRKHMHVSISNKLVAAATATAEMWVLTGGDKQWQWWG